MPSSCHNDSNFLFPLLSALVCLSVLTSPRRPRSLSSSVCCLKASNEIHTKQDGRRRFCLFFAASPFVFLSYSPSLHLAALYCPLLSVLHTSFSLRTPFFGPYFSIVSFSSLAFLFVSFSPCEHICCFSSYFFQYVCLHTWQRVYITKMGNTFLLCSFSRALQPS